TYIPQNYVNPRTQAKACLHHLVISKRFNQGWHPPGTIPTDGQRLDATIKSINLLSKERNPTVEKVIDCGVVNQFDKYLRSPHLMIQGLLRHLNAAPCSVARAKFICFKTRQDHRLKTVKH
ncbi:hypothetical protein MJO28_009801, partial [Puccinia striiformis f. sp. tritici]